MATHPISNNDYSIYIKDADLFTSVGNDLSLPGATATEADSYLAIDFKEAIHIEAIMIHTNLGANTPGLLSFFNENLDHCEGTKDENGNYLFSAQGGVLNCNLDASYLFIECIAG